MKSSSSKEGHNDLLRITNQILAEFGTATDGSTLTCSLKEASEMIFNMAVLREDVLDKLNWALIKRLKKDIHKYKLYRVPDSNCNYEMFIRNWTSVLIKYGEILKVFDFIAMPAIDLLTSTLHGPSELFFMNEPVSPIGLKYYNTIKLCLKKVKHRLVSILSSVLLDKLDNDMNFDFVLEFSNLMDIFGHRAKIFRGIRGDLVSRAIKAITKHVNHALTDKGTSTDILDFLKGFASALPTKLHRKIENDVFLHLTSQINNVGNLIIDQYICWKDINDIRSVFHIFNRTKQRTIFYNKYIEHLKENDLPNKMADPSMFIFNFHYKYLVNKEILELLQDTALKNQVHKYYGECFNRSIFIKEIVSLVDLFMMDAYAQSNQSNNTNFSSMVSFSKLLNYNIQQLFVFIKDNVGYLEALKNEIDRESRRGRRVIIGNHGIKRTKLVSFEQSDAMNNELTPVFQKGFLLGVSQFVLMASDSQLFLSALQNQLAFRILSGTFNLQAEQSFLSYFSFVLSKKMSRMLDDANRANNGVLLMRMCMWPQLDNLDLNLSDFFINNVETNHKLWPFNSIKNEYEINLKNNEKRVRWFDHLSYVNIRLNRIERTITLYQYSILLSVIYDIEFIKPENNLKHEYNLLFEKGLIENNNGQYTINNNCTEIYFIPIERLASNSDSVFQSVDEKESNSAVMAKIASTMKRRKRANRKEIQDELASTVFDECIDNLIKKGIIELNDEDIVYVP